MKAHEKIIYSILLDGRAVRVGNYNMLNAGHLKSYDISLNGAKQEFINHQARGYFVLELKVEDDVRSCDFIEYVCGPEPALVELNLAAKPEPKPVRRTRKPAPSAMDSIQEAINQLSTQ